MGIALTSLMLPHLAYEFRSDNYDWRTELAYMESLACGGWKYLLPRLWPILLFCKVRVARPSNAPTQGWLGSQWWKFYALNRWCGLEVKDRAMKLSSERIMTAAIAHVVSPIAVTLFYCTNMTILRLWTSSPCVLLLLLQRRRAAQGEFLIAVHLNQTFFRWW